MCIRMIRDLLGGWNSVVQMRDEGPDQNGNHSNVKRLAQMDGLTRPCAVSGPFSSVVTLGTHRGLVSQSGGF